MIKKIFHNKITVILKLVANYTFKQKPDMETYLAFLNIYIFIFSTVLPTFNKKV